MTVDFRADPLAAAGAAATRPLADILMLHDETEKAEMLRRNGESTRRSKNWEDGVLTNF